MPTLITQSEINSSVLIDTRRTRPRYFDGKFLTAADLMQEQAYLLTRQADIARTLGFGVVQGLRVTKSDRSASGLAQPAASVKITRGHGLTPAGEVVFLPQAELVVDLDNVAQMLRLNAAFGLSREPQQPFQNLSGLFVLGLRAVEYTANPTPTYPPSVDGNTALRDGEIIEATAIVLVPYESEASLKDSRSARVRAAREIFLDRKPPQLPAGVLPLALLYIRNGKLDWADEWLVRREAGDDDRFGFGFAPHALTEAHFYHYQDVLATRPTANDGQLAARSFLEILPPCGPLPPNLISLADFTQAYFPAEARVELALVPEDEIAALLAEAIDLPPIDLGLKPEDQDALAILVVAPVRRAEYGDVLQTLTKLPQPALRNLVPTKLGQQKPIEALLRMNRNFQLRQATAQPGTVTGADPAPVSDFVDPAWVKVLRKTTQLWYVRRRNLPSGQDLAGTPLKLEAAAIRPPPTDTSGTGAESPGIPPKEDGSGTKHTPSTEAELATMLAKEGLWGRFAFLRAIADAPTHAALAKLLGQSVIAQNPILQQALFTYIEKLLSGISESPAENFDQIQKEPGKKVLTLDLIEKASKVFSRTELVTGLKTVFTKYPKLLEDQRTRAVLGRTNRVVELAQIGLAPESERLGEINKVMLAISKNATTGRAQAVTDAIDKYIKKF